RNEWRLEGKGASLLQEIDGFWIESSTVSYVKCLRPDYVPERPVTGKNHCNGTNTGKNHSDGTNTGKNHSDGTNTGKNHSDGTNTGKNHSDGTNTGKNHSDGTNTGKNHSDGTNTGKNHSDGTNTGKNHSDGTNTGNGEEPITDVSSGAKRFGPKIKNRLAFWRDVSYVLGGMLVVLLVVLGATCVYMLRLNDRRRAVVTPKKSDRPEDDVYDEWNPNWRQTEDSEHNSENSTYGE
ncbi:uncharacterized PPE family protein PPE13-like, partial [Penaeus japonicus]|uniref:uncharacterized PPE family protein PPE13-like n=1 Tax=Penaeus japonicus TaxID=27405 RepID=UPI001C716D0E